MSFKGALFDTENLQKLKSDQKLGVGEKMLPVSSPFSRLTIIQMKQCWKTISEWIFHYAEGENIFSYKVCLTELYLPFLDQLWNEGGPHYWETKFPEIFLRFPLHFQFFSWANRVRKIPWNLLFISDLITYKLYFPWVFQVFSPGAKHFSLKICCTPLWESYFCIWRKLHYICNEKINVGRASSWWLLKCRPLNPRPTGFRPCKSMWFKLGKNWRSSIKNKLTQTDSA